MAILCENNQSMENDLEDGEIEDDEEEEQLNLGANKEDEKEKSNTTNINTTETVKETVINSNVEHDVHNSIVSNFSHKDKGTHRRSEKHHSKHESKSNRKRQFEPEDDWAGNVEKAIASALKIDKEQKSGDSEEEDTEKRKSRKRKKKDRDRDKKKKRKKSDEDARVVPVESGIAPLEEEIDEDEMLCIRGGSPKPQTIPQPPFQDEESPFGQHFNDPYDSYDSEYDSEPYQPRNKRNYDRDRDKKRERPSRAREGSKRDRKNFKEKNRERRQDKNRPALQDSNSICLFYMQGKCHKGDECTYSHAAMPPMKLELCKFYLMDCCAKRDKCLYMHSEFPCKYYHTGLRCVAGERGQCKFAHGTPLSENLKQVLLKHLETAPKEILGDFPRLSREGAQHLVNVTQKKLETQLEPNKPLSNTTNNSASKPGIPSLFDITVRMPTQLLQQNEDQMSDTKTSMCNTIQSDNFTPPMNPLPKTESKSPRSRPSRWNSEKEQININLLPSAALMSINTSFVNNNANNNVFENLNAQDQQKIQNYQNNFGFQGFYSEKDQDMRVMSNGDVDMRSLNLPSQTGQVKSEEEKTMVSSSNNKVDKPEMNSKSNEKKDKSEEQKALTDLDMRDLDMRFSVHDGGDNLIIDNSHEDNPLEIDETHEDMPLKIDVNDEDEKNSSDENEYDLPTNLPKKQRELFLRIKAQQKENLLKEDDSKSDDDMGKDEDWYSSDEESGNPLSNVLKNLKSEDKDERCKDKDDRQINSYQPETKLPVIEPLTLQPGKVINTSELSKIDISAEVTKLLSLVKNQSSSASSPTHTANTSVTDPRMQSRDPRHSLAQTNTSAKENKLLSSNLSTVSDPRMKRKSSTEKDTRPPKISIYELGAIDATETHKDVDLRGMSSSGSKDSDLRDSNYRDTDLRSNGGRSDVDLRQLGLPFKPMQNYVPATEIDASINSHSPIAYKVHICDIPRPDYSGLKLSATDAQATADPRIRKILRIGSQQEVSECKTADTNSPSSPKQSSNSSKSSSSAASARVDPRMQRKIQLQKPETTTTTTSNNLEQMAMNNGASLNYNQQMQLLQNSAFYQTLTSNQKLILNQAIANQKSEQNSMQNDPILATILSNLGLTNPLNTSVMMNPALNIMSLLNLGSNFNPMAMGNMNPSINTNSNNMMPGNIGPLVTSGPNNIGPPSLLGPGPGNPLMNNNLMGPPNEFPNMGFGPVNNNGGNPGLLGHSPYQNMGMGPPGNFGGQSGDNFPQFGDNNGPFFGNVGDDMENGSGFGYGGGPPPNARGDRGFRDRPNRRGGRGAWNSSNCGANRHNSRNNFQSRRNNNKSNRSHTPP